MGFGTLPGYKNKHIDNKVKAIDTGITTTLNLQQNTLQKDFRS